MTQRLITLSLFLTVSFISLGQDTRNVEDVNNRQTSYRYVKKKEKKGFLFFKKKEKTEVEQFRDRLKDVYKQKAKEERLADKPQYSDPLYFGHKKPPKKRPIGKQKMCKVCGIKH